MPEFWVSSGHQLTHRAEGGGLLVSDELLLAYRPDRNSCRRRRPVWRSAVFMSG